MALQLPRLYPILDTASLARAGLPVEVAAEAMLEAGARLLQFRHKGHFSRAALEMAARVAELCRRAGALFIINDRADVASLLEAGLHVGQDDLPPALARRLIGRERVLGFSTHNLEQLVAGFGEPVDYLAFGPVFPTTTKENPDPTVGLGLLRSACEQARKAGLPLVAIGGITRSRALDVLAAGADSIAVISDLLPEPCTRESLRARVEEWLRLLETAA